MGAVVALKDEIKTSLLLEMYIDLHAGYVENSREVLLTKKPTSNKSALTQGDHIARYYNMFCDCNYCCNLRYCFLDTDRILIS